MGENPRRRLREGYRAGPTEIIQYNWGGIIAYLQRDFQFHIYEIIEFAETNKKKGKEIQLAEHIFALIYEGARNMRLKNVHHIRRNERIDAIAGILQHDFEKIKDYLGENIPELSDVDLELLAHQFICAIEDKCYD